MGRKRWVREGQDEVAGQSKGLVHSVGQWWKRGHGASWAWEQEPGFRQFAEEVTGHEG